MLGKQQCIHLPYKGTCKGERVKKSKYYNKAKAAIALPNDRAKWSGQNENRSKGKVAQCSFICICQRLSKHKKQKITHKTNFRGARETLVYISIKPKLHFLSFYEYKMR